jgi:hypothetical protein
MADPKNTPQVEDKEEWVTLSGETLRERYERVRAEEAQMTDEEKIARLRESAVKWDKFLSGESDTIE